MTPKKITATGLKNGGFSIDLSPMTIITGDNGSGKTAVSDALKIIMLGSHPVLGTQNKQLMKLANGPVMEMSAFLGGKEMRTTFTRKGQSVSRSSNYKEEDMEGLMPIVLDFSLFVNAKPTQRASILEEVIPPIDEGSIRKEIENKLAETPKVNLQATNFPDLIKEAGEKGREWKQEQNRLKGAISTSDIELAEEAEGPELKGTMSQMKADRNRLLEEKASSAAKVRELAEKDSKSVPEPDFPKPSEKEIEDAKSFIALEKEKSAKNAEVIEHNQGIREKISQIKQSPEPEKIKAWQEAIAKITQQENKERILLITKRNLKNELEEQLRVIESCDECPTCKASGEVAITTAKAAIQPKINRFEHEIYELESNLQSKKDSILEINNHIEKEKEDHKQRIQEKIEELEKQLQETVPSNENLARDHLHDLESAVFAWEKHELNEPVSIEEKEAARKAFDEASAKLMDIAALIDEEERAEKAIALKAQKQGQLKELRDELVMAGQRITELKEIKDWAKARSLEVTVQSLAPLLAPANKVIQGVIDGEIWIEGTEVGLMDNHAFRPIEVLSGAEASSVAIALQVAIASNTPFPFVILDELSKFTKTRKHSLIRNLYSAIEEGLIEGVILLDHDTDYGFITESGNEKIKVYEA